MAKISISLISDVTSFLRGITQSEDALDDVSGALDDLARDAQRDGDRAGDALERGLESGARESADAVESVGVSFRELARDASRYSRDAGDALDDEVGKGARDANESVEEFRDEARSNFSEVASSFTGDMTSAADLVQGTLGGLAGSLPGPVGIITGLLAGVGGAMFASWQANSEASAQAVSDMYDDMVESGNDFLSESAIQQSVRQILLNEEGRVTDYAEAVKIAESANLDLSVVLRALAGDQKANQVTQKALRDAVEEGEKAFDAARESGEDYNDLLADTTNINGYLGLLERQAENFDTAAGKADAAREATTEWDETLAQLPKEIRTQLGLTRDIASEQDARAAYDGLGRPIKPTVSPTLDTADLDRQIKNYKPPLIQVNGEFIARAGQRVV